MFSSPKEFNLDYMLTYENFTHKGRRLATEKAKYVLVSVSWMEHLGNMPIAEKENFLNKNHPTAQWGSWIRALLDL